MSLVISLMAAQISFAETKAPTVLTGMTNATTPAALQTNLESSAPESAKRIVYVIPIAGPINEAMIYIVRRGVKEAVAKKASAVILDMDTPGGRVDHVEEVMDIVEKFGGDTITFINKTAYSGGAFVSAATKRIYMAPGSVIGAAAPISIGMGGGSEKESDTVEKKYTSAIAARIRAAAQKNGHNPEVFEAMVNKIKGLKIGDTVIVKEGEILTLTNVEAEKEYGTPPRKLVSEGTVQDLEDLLKKVGYAGATVERVEPTGAEQIATWITAIAPILLLLGLLGIYIEFKLQTFGVIGVLAVLCLLIFFFGHYIAGLSGLEFLALFAVGVVLICLEFFVFPGTAVLGIVGAFFIMISLIMAMVDRMPDAPILPTMDNLEGPLMTFGMAVAGTFICALILAKFLPKTAFFNSLVLQTASGGDITAPTLTTTSENLRGATGIATTPLRPAGKAMIGDQLMDVVTEGDHLPKDTPLKVIAVEGARVVVAKA